VHHAVEHHLVRVVKLLTHVVHEILLCTARTRSLEATTPKLNRTRRLIKSGDCKHPARTDQGRKPLELLMGAAPRQQKILRFRYCN
jgi:hypothetical protein